MRTALIVASLALGSSFVVPSPTRPATPSVDPCTLLTAQEVSAALSITSLPGRPFLGSSHVCYYAADTTPDGTKPSVTVMVMTTQQYQGQASMGGALAPHPITGLGDEAYRIGSGSYVKVAARKGDAALSVTVVAGEKSKATPDQVEQIEEGLARKAIARL